MTEQARPILAIHGVANRSRGEHEERVTHLQDRLNRLGGPWKLWPIFWGDLGARDEHLTKTLGDLEERQAEFDWYRMKKYEFAEEEVRSSPRPEGADDERKARFIAEVEKELGRPADPEILEAIDRAWSEMRLLPYAEDEVLESAARAFVEAIEASASAAPEIAAIEGFNLGRLIASLLGADRAAAQLVRDARAFIMTKATLGAADVGVYNAHSRIDPGEEPRIQDRILDCLRSKEFVTEHGTDWGTPSRPISVLAHSLGALVTFDLANRSTENFAVDRFVSFGTQVSTFHLVHKRLDVDRSEDGKPKVRVPSANIGRWTNIWHPLDPLAFVMEPVFDRNDRGDDGYATLRDIRLKPGGRIDVWAIHGMYWTDGDAIQHMAEALTAT